MPSFSHVAGRSINFLAGRDLCDNSNSTNPSAPDCHTVFKVQIIYIIAATLVSVIGFAIAAFIIIRQRRMWRRKQELGQVFVPPPPNPSDPPYDPSIGRPVQNVGLGAPQPQAVYIAPPAYSAV